LTAQKSYATVDTLRTSDLINQTYTHHRRTPPASHSHRPSRLRDLLATGTGGVMVLLLMVGASLLLWLGLPMGTLWLGSWIQTDTDSLAFAVAVMFAVAIAGVVAIGFLLAALGRRHAVLRAARGLEAHARVLEAVLVFGAATALGLIGIWVLLLSSPIPQAVPGILPT
jgi:hypothetical protein